MRVLKGSDFTLTSPTFVDTDGETPADLAAAAVPTVTVTRADGTVATAPTALEGTDPGVYTTTLTYTAHTNLVDTLTVVWTGTVSGIRQVYTQIVEVAGAHYVTIPELRAEPDLSDPVRFPIALLRRCRDEFEDTVERILGRAMVRRYAFETIDGTGTSELAVGFPWVQAVRSVTIDSVAKTASEFTGHVGGWVDWSGGAFPRPSSTSRNISIGYEHGETVTPPPALAREALKCIRMDCMARGSGLPDQTISQQFEGMIIRYSTADPDKGRPTGVKDLDPVLVALGIRPPGIA